MASITTALAGRQDQLIAGYKAGTTTVSGAVIKELETNLWVNAAYTLAPNNLVVRQYCLIDLFKRSTGNFNKISSLLNTLSYASFNPTQLKIWAEGYTYWLYTRDALDLWVARFSPVQMIPIRQLINSVDQGFVYSSYYRNGVLYPAPFGDLRNVPLDINLQMGHSIVSNTCKIVTQTVTKGVVTYTINPRPLGLNTHVPGRVSKVAIVNGVPQPFTFYTGYDSKYESKGMELLDLINPKRILSLFR
jgi:hypothetical protein